jgi:hypothetical protein
VCIRLIITIYWEKNHQNFDITILVEKNRGARSRGTLVVNMVVKK